MNWKQIASIPNEALNDAQKIRNECILRTLIIPFLGIVRW